MEKLAAKVNEIRKALLAAAGVLVTLQATVGVPENLKGYIAQALAVLAAGGITWRVTNKPAESSGT